MSKKSKKEKTPIKEETFEFVDEVTKDLTMPEKPEIDIPTIPVVPEKKERKLPSVPFKVWAVVSNIKMDQLAGFEYYANKVKGVRTLTTLEWYQLYQEYKEKPVK